MKIIADENITFARQAFSTLGAVTVMPAARITPDELKDADALFVRSVTPVNAALLDGSDVKFVGTATIGTDHIDLPYLGQRNIGFTSAPGSNANSVAEYVISSILSLARVKKISLRGKTLGVVGVGNVGKLVVEKAAALKLNCLLCDPPRTRSEGDDGFVLLEQLLSQSDIVTMHVPLVRDGEDKTQAMADASFFAQMKAGSVFLNTSRGRVVVESALSDAIHSGHLAAVVLDVWAGEPDIDLRLLKSVSLATPHIAGYSFDGKVAGTAMVLRAACDFFGKKYAWDPEYLMPSLKIAHVALDCHPDDPYHTLDELVSCVYSVDSDDAKLREILLRPDENVGAYFTSLRKHYHSRREFHHTRVHLRGCDAFVRDMIQGLGFQLG